jgi:hypothetical protein
MIAISEKPTREEVLRFISKSASYGNLGLFIGTGFTKAVLNNELEEIALSWSQLLEKAAAELKVDYKSIPKEGLSYPEIASRLCQVFAANLEINYKLALSHLKGIIANITCWYPNQKNRERFTQYLDAISPAWIITTNYDLVIEALLTGKSIPLGPNDQLTMPRGIVPVMHLHGVRTNPEEIIIAQEDYVALFRPNEYRQIKLALTLKESTTLLLGYGLGDVNVLTALDWSTNVFTTTNQNYPHAIVQVLRKGAPKKLPYRDSNGILIIETDELPNFFEEYTSIRNEDLKNEDKAKQNLKTISDLLNNPREDVINRFIDEKEFRKNLLKTLSRFSIHLISGFISFLDKCIDETWHRSSPNGAFEGYNQNLSIILDILTGFKFNDIPPALFQTTAYGLDRVAVYIGKGSGQSWSAAETWMTRRKELNPKMIVELRNIANQHGYSRLLKLLGS